MEYSETYVHSFRLNPRLGLQDRTKQVFALRMPENKNYSEFPCKECKEDFDCLEGMAKHIV